MEMDSKTRELIGRRITAALALSGKQQKELAKALGVTDNTVSYWCSGARTPNTAQIIGTAEFTGVSADYLLGLSDTSSQDISEKAICRYFGISGQALDGLRYMLGRYDDPEFDSYYNMLPHDKLRGAANAFFEQFSAGGVKHGAVFSFAMARYFESFSEAMSRQKNDSGFPADEKCSAREYVSVNTFIDALRDAAEIYHTKKDAADAEEKG